MKLVKRYRRGAYTTYDDEFDRLSTNSAVLNRGSMERPSIDTVIMTKANILGEIARFKGNENGEFVIGAKDARMAIIPALNNRLADLNKRFLRMNLQREARGQQTFTALPPEMLEEKLKLEASLDCALSELGELEDRIRKGELIEEAKRVENVLQYGLRCATLMHDGMVAEIDFQKVELVHGTPVITDPASPYLGMSLSDYRKLSDVWLAQKRNADADKLQKLQTEAREAGRPVPQRLKASSVKAVDKASLPAWPDGVTNHLKTEKVVLHK
jgi:hypothetical protein